MRNIDYRSFNSGAMDKVALERKWWRLKGEDCAQSVCSVVKTLSEYDSKRMTQMQINARLYGNVSLMGVNGLSFTRSATAANSVRDRVTYNLVQAAADTVTAKICKNKPKPMFLTSGGGYQMQKRAKLLDRFMEGIFYENKVYDLSPIIFRDGAVFGDGVIHPHIDHDRIKFERVLVQELFVDHVESFYGYPRQIHRVKSIDRGVAMELWPKSKKEIEEANNSADSFKTTIQNIADEIQVVESWRLPSGPDAKDGRHIISIPNSVVFEEPWEHQYFPFAFFKWCPRLYGFWSQSLAEQLQNLQSEINKLLWIIQRSMHLAGSFKVLIENGSQIVSETIANDIGALIYYNGTPPQYIVPPAVPPEIYQHLSTLIERGFEQAGVSQLSATSMKPAGLNSGKALREFVDIESDRFQVIGQNYEKMFLDLVPMTIDLVKKLEDQKQEKGYKIRIPGKKFIESIDWKYIDLEADEYSCKAFPVSSLPETPEGKLQTIQEYAQAGFIEPRTARKLLDFPDLEQVENLVNAEEEFLTKMLDRMVDEGKYYQLEMKFDDPNLARELALQYYATAKTQEVPESRLALLRDFINSIDSQMEAIQQQAMAQQAAQSQAQAGPSSGVGTPQAVPAPTPQSQLIPNIPQ